jgi:hypothetical protein
VLRPKNKQLVEKVVFLLSFMRKEEFLNREKRSIS